MNIPRRLGKGGFTLVEFMISMAIFSLILIVVLAAIAQVSKMYSKGVTTSRTQQATRTVLDNISQQIQYSEGTPVPDAGIDASANGANGVICIGGRRYTYVNNRQVDGGGLNEALNTHMHALWSDKTPSDACVPVTGMDDQVVPNGSDILGTGTELLPEGMRLLYLYVKPVEGTSSAWQVKVRVGFGGQDLYETTTGGPQHVDPKDTVCKGSQIGTQFCAVSELETIVQRRVQ